MPLQAPSQQCLNFLRHAVGLGTMRRCRTRQIVHHQQRSASHSLALSPRGLDAITSSDPLWSEVQNSLQTRISDKTYNRQESLRHTRWRISLALKSVEDYQYRDFKRHLNILYRCGEWAEVVRLYECYQPFHENISADSFNSYLQSLVKIGMADKVATLRSTFLSHPTDNLYTTTTANIFCNELSTNGMVNDAIAFVELLHGAEFPLNTVTYNIILSSCKRGSGRVDILNSILDKMRRRHIKLDTFSYNTIIAVCCALRQYTLAQTYLEESIETKHVDAITFNTIINNELSRGNWASAWAFLRRMRDLGILRNAETYQPFLNHLHKEKETRQVPALLRLMQADNIKIGLSTVNVLLDYLLKSSAYVQVIQLLEFLRRSSTKPDRFTCRRLLAHLNSPTSTISVEDRQKLVTLIEKHFSGDAGIALLPQVQDVSLRIPKLFHAKKSPIITTNEHSSRIPDNADLTSESYEIAQDMQRGLWQIALKQYTTIYQRGIRPPMHLFMIMFTGLVQHKRLAEARSLCQDMDRDMLTTNLKFQTSLVTMRHSGPRSTMAHITHTINILKSINAALDIPFFTAAAWRLYKDKRFLEAIHVLKHGLSLGLVFDLVAWVTLIECFSKTMDLVGTVWCLQRMRDNKVLIDRQAKKRLKRIIKTMEADSVATQETSTSRDSGVYDGISACSTGSDAVDAAQMNDVRVARELLDELTARRAQHAVAAKRHAEEERSKAEAASKFVDVSQSDAGADARVCEVPPQVQKPQMQKRTRGADTIRSADANAATGRYPGADASRVWETIVEEDEDVRVTAAMR